MNKLEILKIRKDMGLTQIEFADLIGVDRRTIIHYEQGRTIPTSKIKLLELLASNGLINLSKEKRDLLPVKEKATILSESSESVIERIKGLNDYIDTLKDFLNEKTKVADLYENENKMLREKIASLLQK
jgi:transcriptional regulator with XRE-family HTH domain